MFRAKVTRFRWLRLAHALALAAPASAEIVVESAQAPPGAVSPLVAGDELLRWRLVGSSPPRSGELTHWGELDLLPLVESPRGTLEIDLVRARAARTERLPPAAWSFKGRPAAASGELVAFVAGFAAKESPVTADDVARRIAAEPADSRSWAWARFAEARGKRSDWAGAASAYAAAIALAPSAVAADLALS